MNKPAPVESRPYHHGDLRRALIEAARRILEADGPAALSLRGVAREAGVSPAAPYHHFKDKGELLDAVAHEGFEALAEALKEAKRDAETAKDAMSALGVAYVRFSRENPALYRVMSDCSRDKDAMPDHLHDDEDSAYCTVRNTLVEAGLEGVTPLDLELATIAAWCAAHGLAEMSGFRQFETLKKELGGEEAFLRGVLEHLGMFAKVMKD
jgi:AcrR family transcriptional regulator